MTSEEKRLASTALRAYAGALRRESRSRRMAGRDLAEGRRHRRAMADRADDLAGRLAREVNTTPAA